MTYDEAAAAIGRRVRVSGGKYDGCTAIIDDMTRRLAELRVRDHDGAWCWTQLSPYRLTLIEEEETDANP